MLKLSSNTLATWCKEPTHGKDPDAGKDWGQEAKGTTEDEMFRQHHWLNGHEFAQTPGDGGGQGSLACYSPWGHKELDTTEQLNNNNSGWARILRLCNLYKELPLGFQKVNLHIRFSWLSNLQLPVFKPDLHLRTTKGTALVCMGKVAGATENKLRVSLWAGAPTWRKTRHLFVLQSTEGEILQVQFEGSTFLPWLMMTHFTQNSFFLFAKTVCHLSTRRTLCFSMSMTASG